jgi:hypothetical protein
MATVGTTGVVTWLGRVVPPAERYAATTRHVTATRRQIVTAALLT